MSISLFDINVGILFEDFGPYHKTRIEALAAKLACQGAHLYAFRMYTSSEDYSWNQCLPSNAKVITLCRASKGNSNALLVALGFVKSIHKLGLRAVFLPSYSPLANLLCFLIAKVYGCKTVLMTESWLGCENKSILKKIVKKNLIPLFDSALVGGVAQREYLVTYGFPCDAIHDGYNVVDNNYFELNSREPNNDCPLLGSLPPTYFLNLGRFVRKKNLTILIEAYSIALSKIKHHFAQHSNYQTDSHGVSQPSLVLVGEGEMFDQLLHKAFELGLNIRNGAVNMNTSKEPEIIFLPFQQISIVPMIMSRSIAFILPSLWEEWGLVINEAMACGVPVIVSNNVGCSFELIKDGVTGLLFDPRDSQHLADLLVRCFLDAEFRHSLAINAKSESKNWSPKRFADGAVSALLGALVIRT